MYLILSGTAIAVWPVAAVILVMLLIVIWYKNRSFSHLLCSAIFGVYLVFVIIAVFFPIFLNPDHTRVGIGRFLSSVNLRLFDFDMSFIPETVLRQIFQNVLLTVPFGFGVSFVVRLGKKDFLWLVPAVGIGIELMQFIISIIIGYPYRVVDINDAILNSIGVLIGYGVFRVFAAAYVALTTRFNIRHIGLSAYFYQVTARANV